MLPEQLMGKELFSSFQAHSNGSKAAKIYHFVGKLIFATNQSFFSITELSSNLNHIVVRIASFWIAMIGYQCDAVNTMCYKLSFFARFLTMKRSEECCYPPGICLKIHTVLMWTNIAPCYV